MSSPPITRILFICMGNICRSPMAEGVFRRLLTEAGLTQAVQVDSAGTHSYHEGSEPDNRSQETARRRGLDLSAIRARRVRAKDFMDFDYLLVMDRQNHHDLLALCPQAQYREKIQLLMDYAPTLPDREVPDPYYGGPAGFELMMDLIEEAAEGLLTQLRKRHRF